MTTNEAQPIVATEPPPVYPAPPRSLGALMASYFVVQLVVNTANTGAAGFLVPLQLDDLDPATKVAHLGLIGTVAAVLGIIAQPLWGALSDRTRTRFGRRVPWVLGGIVGLAACMVALAFSSSFLAILVFAASLQIFYSMVAAPLFALVPDRTPVTKRGTFSALGGLGIYLGSAAGLFAASPFAGSIPTGYLVLAALILVVATPLALLVRRDSKELPRPERVGVALTLASFWVSPRKHPDFFWAFVSRLVLMSGFWGVTSFLLYQLQDYVGLDQAAAAAAFPLLSLALVVGILIAIVPAGRITDRLGRRKPLVLVASIMIGVAMVFPLVSATVGGLAIALVISGLALGAYLSVDQALMTLVLPTTTSSGKDLGVLNIAQSGGQVLAPAVASVVIGLAGYPGLYVFAGIMAILGGLAILPIKSVR
jgi:MFS family permease